MVEQPENKEEKSGNCRAHLTYATTFERKDVADVLSNREPPQFLKGAGEFTICRMRQIYDVDFVNPLGALLAVGQIVKEDPSAFCSLIVCPEVCDEAETAQAQEPEAPPATRPERPASVPPPEEAAPVGTAQPAKADAA
jgi:hypothetical protein